MRQIIIVLRLESCCKDKAKYRFVRSQQEKLCTPHEKTLKKAVLKHKENNLCCFIKESLYLCTVFLNF